MSKHSAFRRHLLVLRLTQQQLLLQHHDHANSGLPPPQYLGLLSLSGSAAFSGSPQDYATLCVQGSGCYSRSNTDNALNLYQNWLISEFNIFGYGGGSQAQFNGATAIRINDDLQTQSGGVITPACYGAGFTGETNNLTALRGCSLSGSTMQFTEGAYQLAMLTSGCCGSVSPTSGGQLAGKIVTITATPNSGCYSFNGWTGSGSGSYTGSANPAMVTMNGDITETASFIRFCL